MTPRARSTPPAQQGFILIEVLVSALILAIVAGAVLALLAATTHSAASERAHSAAYALAQEDQARLRTMRISSLNHLNQPRTVELDGTKFSIRSEGLFVNSSTGNESCSSESSPADYVRITSTVSSAYMTKPVVLQSIVSPSNGSLDPSHGTLSFGFKNGAGQPLSGVSISATGASSFSGSSDSTGCANFADLPSGNYKVTTSAGGMINPQGETSTTKEIGVPASGTQVVSMMYDNGGSIPVEFKYRVGSSETFLPATADSVEVYNAEAGSTAKTFGTPGGTRALTVNATPLFPFKTQDTVYAGSCETNNPDPKEEKPANRAAMAFPLVPSGNAVSPPPVIQLPALNLTVTYKSKAVSGARVTVTDANSNCKFNGNPVKRVYTSNETGNLSSAAKGIAEPGLPWGKYKVCASGLLEGQYRRIEASGVEVENLTKGTSLELNLSSSSATVSSKSSNECP